MEQLREGIKNFTDDQLIDIVVFHKKEYTPEALVLIDEEIKRRNLDIVKMSSAKNRMDESTDVQLDNEDFTRFDHVFNHMDIQLAAAVLRENGIIFYIDNPSSSDTIPLEGESVRQFTIHVHNSAIEAAHALLDEHFEKQDGKYRLKEMGVRARLKAFNFHDIQISEKDAAEMVDVSLTQQEKEVIVHYGKRVVNEIDQLEQEKCNSGESEPLGFRAVFYFDSIDPLIDRLSCDEEHILTKTELLTILEILQIFCDASDFPEFMEEPINALLSFFDS